MIETIKSSDNTIVGFPQDYLFKCIKDGDGFPDSFLLETINKYVNKDSVCVDIGANLGYVSLYLSRICKKVYSFEPQHVVFLQLCANVFLNERFNVYPLELAAYSESKLFNFAVYQNGWVKASSFDDYNNIGSIGSISLEKKDDGNIKAVRPDEIIKEKVDFIKIDAQGGDIDAIFGCEKLLENRPVIVFEYEHDLSVNNYGRTLPEILPFAQKHNYGMRAISGQNYILEPL